MEISKEDQERIERDAAQYSANFDEYKAEQAEDDFFEGAIHEHLTQVLPLREKLQQWDETMKLVGLHPRIEDWTKEIQSLKEENESLKHDIADLRSYCGMTVTEQNSMLEEIERLREALNKFLGIAEIRSLNETSLFTKSEKEEIDTLLTETKKP